MMQDKKKEIKWFDITQYEQEAEYLRNMNKRGWKFTGVKFPGRYCFEKCEPEDVVYQLDYNQEGRENKEEYLQMFQDCGWEYILDFAGYSYFRKAASEMEQEESIFCDDESRLEMMKRVYRGRILPLITIFCCCLLPQLVSMAGLSEGGYVTARYIAGVLAGLLILYMIVFIRFGIGYSNCKKKLNRL